MENIDDLIELVDYVPFSFADYNAQEERDEFLKSKNLLATMKEMDQLITAKCEYYEDSAKAWNSVLIEWLDCHPNFEGIISKESFIEYRTKINNNDFSHFPTFLYTIELPSEKKVWEPSKTDSFHRDDSVFNYLILKRRTLSLINMGLLYCPVI